MITFTATDRPMQGDGEWIEPGEVWFGNGIIAAWRLWRFGEPKGMRAKELPFDQPGRWALGVEIDGSLYLNAKTGEINTIEGWGKAIGEAVLIRLVVDGDGEIQPVNVDGSEIAASDGGVWGGKPVGVFG